MNLYQLTASQSMLISRLEDAGFDEQTIADTLEGESDDLQERRLAYIAVINSKEAMITARVNAMQGMQDLIQSDYKTIERLTTALIASMTATGDRDLVGVQFVARLHKNLPSVDVFDTLSIPRKYMRFPEVREPVAAPDKAAIKVALQLGQDVPGAKLTQSVRLVVK